MDALALLLTRTSQARLHSPAPQGQALENIMQAALRAPDHAGLSPWRFIVCADEGLTRLGEIFEQAAIEEDMSAKEQERASGLPKRAPMVIIAYTQLQAHPKVPDVEQIASAACCVHAMQMAAVAQGFTGIWRTGGFAHSQAVKKALGIPQKDEIVGFLYLGTNDGPEPQRPLKDSSDYFQLMNS